MNTSPKSASAKLTKKVIARNKKAFHDYFVEETFEAGIALVGTEVKSLRAGRVNLKDAYCTARDGQLTAYGIHISPYEKGTLFNHDPVRPRALLMHRREILRLGARAAQQGLTLVPLSLYFVGSRVKLELGLCRGKKLYDKRETEAKREASRTIARYEKQRGRGE